MNPPKPTPHQIEGFAKAAGASGGSGSGAASTASKLAGSAGGDAGFVTVGGALKSSPFFGAVAFSAYDVAKAPPAQRLHTATRDATGLAGAAYGAEAGAAIGSAIPGAGTVVGGLVGGVVGGIIGSGMACEAAEKFMDLF
ncbi:hypothetical protein [Streptomyces sp. NPDC127036]|uniref:hypothetical protein n=1 Tax=Streptomyces sp. NPDC127036 TaxID=3347112 RepID=UPI003652BFE6